MSKRAFTLIVAILLTATLWAQSPEKMSYQAVIRNADNTLVTNQSVGMQISILQGSADGIAVYMETQTPTSNANGLISIEIGVGTNVSGDFVAIDWANGPYFIKTETDPVGGENYTITGTSQLLSVPYALHAKTAESITGGITETDPVYTGSEASNITAADIENLSNLSGVNTGDQDISGIATNVQAIQDTASQIRSDIPDVSGFITSETDPAYTASEAVNITATDISNLGNLSGTNTGDQDISGIATNQQALIDTADQIRADIPDVSGFITSETDPAYTASEAANITATDITNLGNLSGTNTGDQDLSTLATKTALGDSTAQVRSEIPDVSGFLTTETDPSVPTGTQAGDMQYWNGTAWVTVSAGNEGQVLTFSGGIPIWKTLLEEGEVDNPVTGEIWMDRNLGASQVATSSTDAAAYGDLYQWGRAADGHEDRGSLATTTLATSNTPGHGNFIVASSNPNDWRNPQNDNLWQDVNGTNNPCPSGYRLPTEAEWEAERASWISNNAAGAFASPLKLPVAGYRSSSSGSLYTVGSFGNYWSSAVDGTFSRRLSFYSSDASMTSSYRAVGYSVRCLKD